jgi:hypothetical protein
VSQDVLPDQTAVTNFPGTQPVSGSVSVSNFPGTQPVSAASLPLPSGAAQEHTGAASYHSVRLTDGSAFYAASGGGGSTLATASKGTTAAGSPTSSNVDANTQALDVKVNGTVSVSGTFWQATQPVSGTFWQATQPVSAASLPLPSGAATAAKQPALGTAGSASTDVLSVQGIASMTALKVDGSAVTQPVSGTFWQATQPVSGTFWQATQPVSGTVTANQGGTWTVQPGNTANTTAWKVDGSAVTQPVSGTFWQATQPVSGTLTANQGGAPWSENITQIGGSALALKALPTNGSGQAAIPVWINATEMATYEVVAAAISSGALTANTAKQILSLEHAAGATKTVKIRRIIISGVVTTGAATASIEFRMFRGTAASSAGTAITPQPVLPGTSAAEAVAKSLPTMTAATVLRTAVLGYMVAATTQAFGPWVFYDWQEGGEVQPFTLRSANLDTLALSIQSTGAITAACHITVLLTEE